MMQTRFLQAAAILAGIFVLHAHTSPVNRTTACQVAASWFAERGNFAQETVRVVDEVPVGQYELGLLDAFNMEPPGFVLVASKPLSAKTGARRRGVGGSWPPPRRL